MDRRSFLIGAGSILTTAFVDKADGCLYFMCLLIFENLVPIKLTTPPM